MTEIVLKFVCGRNGTGTLTARLGDDILHSDRLNPLGAAGRKRFKKDLLERHPGLDGDAIDRELLGIADRVAKAAESAPVEAPELDFLRIVRPELFHTAEVSGVAVPVVGLVGGRPSARWALYLRWHGDGKREQRELERSIEVPGASTFWLDPTPNEPSVRTRPGWTAKGRRGWLGGGAAPDPVDVYKRICERFACFLEFEPDSAPGTTSTLVLWTILTYIYPAWSTVPYISIGGPLRSGKTTVFRVLARLIFRPLESSNMTAPCLFRTLHDCGGVLLLDEAERLWGPDAVELRSILLSGYKRGSPARRLEKVGDTFKQVEYDVFGPKAIAGIAALPEALASRCVRIRMFRAGDESPKPRRRLDANPTIWAGLRDDLHVLALEFGRTWPKLAGRDEVVPSSLGGRDYELWQPLLALAAWLDGAGASGLLTLMQEYAMQAAEAAQDDAVNPADETLLRILAAHVLDGTSRTLKAGDVSKQARDVHSVTFKNWSPKGVANAIGRYGLGTQKATGKMGRVYSKVALTKLRQVEAVCGFSLGLPAE